MTGDPCSGHVIIKRGNAYAFSQPAWVPACAGKTISVGKDEKRGVLSNRPGPKSQKQVRIKKAVILHEIVFPGSPGSRCIRPDHNLKYPATQEQPGDRGSMLGLRHHKKRQRICLLTTTMDSRLRGKDEKRRVPSNRPGPKNQK